MITAENLLHFTGTEHHYRHWTKALIFTDGIHYLEENGAAWLLDVIASHQMNAKLKKGQLADFQVWELKVNPDKTAVVTCRADSKVPPAITQKIEYTDFPLDGIKLWVETGSIDGINTCKILMLPSER